MLPSCRAEAPPCNAKTRRCQSATRWWMRCRCETSSKPYMMVRSDELLKRKRSRAVPCPASCPERTRLRTPGTRLRQSRFEAIRRSPRGTDSSRAARTSGRSPLIQVLRRACAAAPNRSPLAPRVATRGLARVDPTIGIRLFEGMLHSPGDATLVSGCYTLTGMLQSQGDATLSSGCYNLKWMLQSRRDAAISTGCMATATWNSNSVPRQLAIFSSN
jgi:hypothetical protein